MNENITDEKVTPWIAWLEKQGEQKPTWSEEDEKIYQSIMDDTVQENQLNSNQTNWLRDIKYRYFPQPKQEYSEEDEKKNEDEAIRSNPIPELPSSAFRLGFKLGWFKALKKRVQSNQEWKQPELKESEDERIIDNLISQLCNLYTRKLIKEETKDKYVNWLKSLKERIKE